MLRNPVDLVYAFHAEMIRNHCEDVEDFESAWGMRHKRKNGEMLPKYMKYHRHERVLDYESLGYLGAQLERVYQCFPKKQVKVIFLEDLAADTRTVYASIIEFLGLSHYDIENYDVHNANYSYRSLRFARWMHKPPEKLRTLSEKVKLLFGIEDLELLRYFRKKNLNLTKRRPLSVQLSNEIQNIYREDIAKLSGLTGRSLEHWLK